MQNMKTPMIVITPKGPIEVNHMTHRLTLTIMGREFWATTIILEASSIDLILGMSWLRKAKAVIACGRGTVELTTTKGERFQVEIPSFKMKSVPPKSHDDEPFDYEKGVNFPHI